LLDRALAGIAERPQITYETQSGTTLLGLVEAGLGVAAVPAMATPVPNEIGMTLRGHDPRLAWRRAHALL